MTNNEDLGYRGESAAEAAFFEKLRELEQKQDTETCAQFIVRTRSGAVCNPNGIPAEYFEEDSPEYKTTPTAGFNPLHGSREPSMIPETPMPPMSQGWTDAQPIVDPPSSQSTPKSFPLNRDGETYGPHGFLEVELPGFPQYDDDDVSDDDYIPARRGWLCHEFPTTQCSIVMRLQNERVAIKRKIKLGQKRLKWIEKTIHHWVRDSVQDITRLQLKDLEDECKGMEAPK